MQISNRMAFGFIALWFCAVPTAHAHVLEIIPYQRLFEKSDFIAIAVPVTKTTDTQEKTFYSNLAQVNADGSQSPVPAIGVETAFDVLMVLKGNSDVKRFVLHHYRDAPSPELSFGGAATVSFDPTDAKQPHEFLMFLIREKDGRYAPYGDQTDPNGRSIMSVNGSHD